MEIELFPFVYLSMKIDLKYLPATLYIGFFGMIVKLFDFKGTIVSNHIKLKFCSFCQIS